MRLWVGRKEIDIHEVGSIVIELDDLDKKLIGSMSPRETKYGASVVLPENKKVFRSVMGPANPANVEERVPYGHMKALLEANG